MRLGRIRLKVKIALRDLVRGFLLRYMPSVFQFSAPSFLNNDASASSIISHVLENTRDPVGSLNFLTEVVGVPVPQVRKVLNDMRGRALDNHQLLRAGRSRIVSQELQLRLDLDEAIYFRNSLNCGELDGLIDRYTVLEKELVSSSSLRGHLVTLIIQKAPIIEIEKSLNQIGVAGSDFSDTQKIQLLARIKSAGDIDLFKCWYGCLEIASSSAEIKALQLRGELIGGGRALFEDLEKRFLGLGCELSRCYRDEFQSQYATIPADKDLTWIQYDNAAIAAFKDRVISRVVEGQPLSYIRVNDGECYGFSDGYYVDEEGIQRQERHWWGVNLNDGQREEIKHRFLNAVSKADVLGVPTVIRLIKDFKIGKRDAYRANSVISRTLCVMKGVGPLMEGKEVIEGQSNLFLFDSEFCERLFEVSEKVCVISGLSESAIRRWAPAPEKLVCIEIPTHRLLQGDSDSSSAQGILPEVYEDILCKVAELSRPGVVFLVSAGFIGKSFISEAAKSGSVALDIGQSLVAIAKESDKQ